MHSRALLPLVLITCTFIRPVSSQTTQPQQPVLEFVLISCSFNCNRSQTRVYREGGYFLEAVEGEKAKSGKTRHVTIKAEKKLEAAEVAELIAWAEDREFLEAQEEYAKIVIDSPSHITVFYRTAEREKKIRVANYHAMNAEAKAKIPSPVMKLIRWAYPGWFN